MNRTDLIVLLLTASFAMFTLFQNAHAGRQNLATEMTKVETNMNHSSRQILGASYRLVHYSKMVAVESLIITNESINIVFDSIIESL